MHEHAGNPDAEEARRALAVAERACVATEADRSRLEHGLIGIGVAVGVLILALRLTVGNVGAPSWLRFGGFAVVMLAYFAAIGISVVAMRRAHAAPRGFTVRYTIGLAGAFVVYVAYVLWQSADTTTSIAWAWAVLASLAAMTPALLAAHSISKLPVR